MNRERLPNRRFCASFEFQFEGHGYRASVGRYPDGRLAEVFLDCHKPGTSLQANANAAAMLASLCLQHGVDPETIVRSVSGPVSVAISLAVQA